MFSVFCLKKRKRGDDESECESDLDLEKPLTAIGSYIKNRHETVEHMFRSISQVKLRGMLPDILKVNTRNTVSFIMIIMT